MKVDPAILKEEFYRKYGDRRHNPVLFFHPGE